MGDHVLYMKRHITRAYDEIYKNLLLIPVFQPYEKLIQLRPKIVG